MVAYTAIPCFGAYLYCYVGCLNVRRTEKKPLEGKIRHFV